MRSKRLFLGSVLAGVALLACSESAAPPVGQTISLNRTPHHVRWAATPRLAAVVHGAGTDGATRVLEPGLSLSNLGLDAYQISFWAVRGQEREVRVNYEDANGRWQPYLNFTVPKDALWRRPGGALVATDDSVLITLTVEDPDQMVVRFAPAGLQFRPETPADLEMWYTGARGDLNTDTYVNGFDASIELNQLGIWYQSVPGTPWTLLPSVHDPDSDWFKADIDHFSGYAISW